jgi:hypothetical protein
MIKFPKLSEVFPFTYVAGGFFRKKGVPIGQKAEGLDGMKAIEYLYTELQKRVEETNPPPPVSVPAYLVVLCHPDTNIMIRADVWSSPEWDQSRCLEERVFVLLIWEGETYQDAKLKMLRLINDQADVPYARYNYVKRLMDPRLFESL